MESHRSPLFLAAWEATRSNLTPDAASRLSGGRVSAKKVYSWVRGSSVPTLEGAEHLAKALGRLDLVSWLGEGKLFLERLRQAADEVDGDGERCKPRLPMPGKMVEHLPGPEPGSARGRRRSGSEGNAMAPADCLKRLEAHRFPLFLAAWEATRSDRTWEQVSLVTGFRIRDRGLRRWVRGRTVPTLDQVEILAKALGGHDLVSWLGEGKLYLDSLRQAVACDAERRKGHRRMVAEIRRKGAGDAIAEHFRGLSRGRRDGLLRHLRKLPK